MQIPQRYLQLQKQLRQWVELTQKADKSVKMSKIDRNGLCLSN